MTLQIEPQRVALEAVLGPLELLLGQRLRAELSGEGRLGTGDRTARAFAGDLEPDHAAQQHVAAGILGRAGLQIASALRETPHRIRHGGDRGRAGCRSSLRA
ncbi:MAG: hypothetical protein IPJ34_13195 [Myxococcales bacterium]|nr:hypothetical protein [Myxococcales bacterium]